VVSASSFSEIRLLIESRIVMRPAHPTSPPAPRNRVAMALPFATANPQKDERSSRQHRGSEVFAHKDDAQENGHNRVDKRRQREVHRISPLQQQ